ncbi:hemerythrin domain-containing protein [Phenylobacterium sp.]|uniref:hemerythrin domain-containing protein n=1 Tax=Phenylobacterium sp. TaxID=1871053 RepID=UPI0025D578B4|nr:hemerythrin domain-containing protein [Phenylobacterium sp.]
MRPQAIDLTWTKVRDGDPAPANDAAPFDVTSLLERIVERYHRTHLRDLASAIALADEAENSRASDPTCPPGLGDHLRRLAAGLEAQQRREEFSLFPLLRIGTPRCVAFVTRQMMDDHVDMELRLDALRRFNSGHRPSFEAPLGRQALSFLCRKLEADLKAHARLEHEVLYAALVQQRMDA